jgi:hypothetical protein
MTMFDMVIKGIVTGVEDSAFKPAVKRGIITRKDPVRRMVPPDVFCCRSPETFRIRYRFPERPFILTAHAPLLPDVYTKKSERKGIIPFQKCTSDATRGAEFQKNDSGMVQGRKIVGEGSKGGKTISCQFPFTNR